LKKSSGHKKSRRITARGSFVEPLIEECLAQAKVGPARARYAGRKASASPATGLMKRHQAEQAALIAHALSHGVRDEIRRQRTTKKK